MLKAARTILRLRRNGIKVPIIAYQEARRTGCNLAALCAVLEQETGGGRNVYGHDRDSHGRIIWHGSSGTVKVTKKNYLRYRAWRRANRNRLMQGVGPMQLTWYSYQDEADKLGGCWNPRYNVRVGAKLLKSHRAHYGSWHKAFRAYNGSEAYANQVDKRFKKWSRIV